MSIKFNDYKLLCNKGSATFNEDVVGLSPYGAWVIDGATGLNGKNLVSNESDAKWYVNWWNKYLHENLNREQSLKEIVKNGIEEITKEYHKLIGDNKIEPIDFPSSACSIIKFYKDKIEYLILGDCTLLVSKDKKIETYKDDDISLLDKSVFDYIESLEDVKTMSFNEKKSNAMHIIINNRLKKNTVGGYWSLEFSKEAVENSINGFIEVDDDMKIMMASDGFSCAYDKYDLFTKEEMFSVAQNQGIDYIYNKLRAVEKSDENGLEYTRFKVHDDSSCIYLDIYKN